MVLATAAAILLIAGVNAQNAYFAIEGKLVEVGEKTKETKTLKIAGEAGEYFGQMADGNLVAGLGAMTIEQGYNIKKGYMLAIITPQGEIVREIAADVIRAYPSAAANAIAFLDIQYSPWLYRDGKAERLTLKHKVIQFAWLPDGSGFIYTGKPSDWSPVKINNPENTEEFMRLANSDLFLYKLADGSATQLTDQPREDWNPAISPDGKTVLFQSSRVSYSCFWKMNIDGTGLEQVTFPKPGFKYEENVPIAYTDQLFWNGATNTIIYGTSTPESVKEIRLMNPDGAGARLLGRGAKPQIFNKGESIAFIADKNEIKTLSLK